MKPQPGVINMVFGEAISLTMRYKDNDTIYLIEATVDMLAGPITLYGTYQPIILLNEGVRTTTGGKLEFKRVEPHYSATVLSMVFKLLSQWEERIISRCKAALEDDDILLEGGFF